MTMLQVETGRSRRGPDTQPEHALNLGDVRHGGREAATDETRRAAAALIAGRSPFAMNPDDLLKPSMNAVGPVAVAAAAARDSLRQQRTDQAMRRVERDLPSKVEARVAKATAVEVDGAQARAERRTTPGRLQGQVTEDAIAAAREEMTTGIDGRDSRSIEAGVALRAQGVGATAEARIERERQQTQEKLAEASPGAQSDRVGNPNANPTTLPNSMPVGVPNKTADRSALKGRIGSSTTVQEPVVEAIPVAAEQRKVNPVAAPTSIADGLRAMEREQTTAQAPQAVAVGARERSPEREMSRAKVLDPDAVARRLQQQASSGSRIALGTQQRATADKGTENTPLRFMTQVGHEPIPTRRSAAA